MAEMSTSDDHHWSHLTAKTEQAAEKILTEGAISGTLDTTPEPEKEPESPKLAPSISGAIESFMSKNKDKELSDK